MSKEIKIAIKTQRKAKFYVHNDDIDVVMQWFWLALMSTEL